MKRTVLFSISIILLACLLWVSYNKKTAEKISAKGIDALAYKTSDFDEEEKEDGIAEAQRQEFELTKDVHLGYIPKYRLVSAFQDLVNQRKKIEIHPITFPASHGWNVAPIRMSPDRVMVIFVLVMELRVAV